MPLVSSIRRFATRLRRIVGKASGGRDTLVRHDSLRTIAEFRARLRATRMTVEGAYMSEISSLREFFQRMTFLSLALAFIFGLILGGVLSSPPSIFIIGTLSLGFPAAIAYGVARGIAPAVSALLAVGVNCFVAYAVLRSIKVIETNERLAPYVYGIRTRYEGMSMRIMSHAGAVGVGGSLAIFSFLVGWWVAVLVAYILNVEERTAMKGIIVGNLAGAVMSLAIFQGLLAAIPHTGIVSLIFVTIFIVSAFLARRASREKEIGERSEKTLDSDGQGVGAGSGWACSTDLNRIRLYL